MSCVQKYFTPDGQESELYNELVRDLGQWRAEEVYLTTKTRRFTEKFIEDALYNTQGEPTIEFVRSVLGDPVFKVNQNLFEQKAETPASLTRTEIKAMLENSSSKITSATDTTPYQFGSIQLERVSNIVNKYVPYRGDQTGKDYADSGTRYHKIIEYVINGFTDKDIDSKLDTPIEAYEKAFIGQVRNYINNLRKEGTLISEVRVALNDKGIAGTLDIILIKDNGKAVVIDIKTANETEWKRNVPHGADMNKAIWSISDFNYYKAERYSLQTVLYAGILEKTDNMTSRLGIEVEDILVLPVEIHRDSSNEITFVNMLPAESIKDWKAGTKSFYKKAKRISKEPLEGKPIKTKIIGRDSESADLGEFLKQALNIEDLNFTDVRSRALKFVEARMGSKTFRFEDSDGISWVNDNKEDRINQVASLMTQQDQNFAGNLSSGIETYFNTEYKNKEGGASNFTQKDAKTHIIRSARTSRLQRILQSAGAKSVIKLSEIPGFKSYGDVVAIKRSDGSYDLLTFTSAPHGIKFDVKNKSRFSGTKALQGNEDTIFGNLMSPYDAKLNGVSLENNYGDFMRMRLGLIALDLMSSNPEMKVNRIIVDEMYSGSIHTPMAMNLSAITPQLKVMAAIPEVKGIIPSNIESLINENNLSESQDDPIKDLYNYLSSQITEPINDKLAKQIDRYKASEITKDALADEILNSVVGIRGVIKTKYSNISNPDDLRNALSADKNFIALSRAWVNLKGIGVHPESDVSEEFFGQISKWIKSPTATGRKTLDKFFDLFRRHMDNIKRETQEFVKFKDPYFRELINQDPLFKRGISISGANIGGSDVVFGMSRSIMEPLIQKKKDINGNTYLIPFLISKDSPEWNKLTATQRKVIKMFNETVQKYYPGVWAEGQIPIMKISTTSLQHRAKNNLSKGDFLDALVDAKKATSTYFSSAANRGNFLTGSRSERQFSDIAHDAFGHQVIPGQGTFTTNALEQMGLDQDLNLLDPAKNREFEFDLEKILTLFSSHYIKKAEIDKALPMYHMFRSIFKYYEIAYGLNQPDTIEMIDSYVADLAFNIKQGEDEIVSQFVNTSIRISSIALIGLNWKVFLGNTIQMSLASATDMLTNTLVNDPRFPGIKAWNQASARMTIAMSDPAEMTKMILLRQKYLTEDFGTLVGEKYQATARGMINEQLAYAIDRQMELGFRTHHLVAQMMKDGVYDAHTVERVIGEDGFARWELRYDPKKDPRFKGKDGEAFYEAIKNSMAEKGELNEAGEITGAYDWHLRERLKAYIARGIGSFDRDLASPWARKSLFFAISQFRNWFTNKFIRSTKIEYDADIFGDWKKSDDGRFVWSSEPMKGILWTLSELHQLLPRVIDKGWDSISLEDKRNLAYSVTSASATLLLFLLASALKNATDDDEFNDLKALSINAIKESVSHITLAPMVSILTSPVVFASYYQRLFQTIGKVINYGSNGEGAQAWNNFVDIIPILNKIPSSMIDLD